MPDPQNQVSFKRNFTVDKDIHVWNARLLEDWMNNPKDLAQMTGDLNATGGTISGVLTIGDPEGLRLDLGPQVVGGVTYFAILWDGAQRFASLRSDGQFYVNSLAFGSNSFLRSDDAIQLQEVAGVQTPAFIQSAKNTGTGVSTLSKAWTGSTVAGHLLVVAFAWKNQGLTVSSAPSGYTQLGTTVTNNASGGSMASAVYYKANCGAAEGAPSITVSGATDIVMAQAEYSNLLTASPLDRNSNSTGTGTANMALSGTTSATTQAYEAWIAALATHHGGPFLGVPQNGFTLREEAALGTMELEFVDKIVTATNAASVSHTYQYSSSYDGHIGTFKAVSTTIGTPPANSLVMYAKDLAAVTRLYDKDDGGTEHGPF